MTDYDYSQRKGIADEPHWNEFVVRCGGELVAPHIKRQSVKNADYMFPAAKVVAELKILETEFGHSKENLAKISKLVAEHPDVDPLDPNQALFHEILMLIKHPLQRIVKKANRQIRETKQELGLVGWHGVLICVNDNFKGARPGLVQGMIGHILAGERYSSIDCFVYQTNHYIELAESPYASLLWSPLYDPGKPDSLCDFINDLGREWRKYQAEIEGEPDASWEMDSIDMSRTYVVDGPSRVERYIEPDAKPSPND